MPHMSKRSVNILIAFLFSVLTACSAFSYYEMNERFGEPEARQRYAQASESTDLYHEQVEPVLNSRCVVCHACYDAPCQLKLSSPEGLDRGISQTPVYSGKRLIADKPTRLFIDQPNTAAWRAEGFDPVLNERSNTEVANLEGSLIYQLLALKKQHPLPNDKQLPSGVFDFSLKRENQCPTIETYADYAEANPLAGMPYGLPGLTEREFDGIQSWLKAGASLPTPKPLSKQLQDVADEWEALLNQTDNKSRLVARYLFEHLFLANLYFDEVEPDERSRTYFKIVRSSTNTGEPIHVVASRRPSDEPAIAQFYYRLQPQTTQVVSKTHLPYPLNRKRRERIDELFFKPEYTVASLPGYSRKEFNPFYTYREIPSHSRYRFLLDNAHYYIAGFIKGPVCRGQVAVDVINDHFWVFFVDPKAQALPMLDGFLEQQIPNLRMPGEQGSNGNLLSYWTTYSDLHKKYVLAKADLLKKVFANHNVTTDLVWDGNGKNDNAALTVFRNFDDAAVVKGLLGNPPKTAWIIDYPLLERIHYLLTVDFDVFGNVAHQLNTRLYMDFLRIEGEYNLLTLLPAKDREPLRDFWYRDSAERLNKHLYGYNIGDIPEPGIAYEPERDSKLQLYEQLQKRVAEVVSHARDINNAKVPSAQSHTLQKLHGVKGAAATHMAESTLLLVTSAKGPDQLYTILANRAHLNITSLFSESENRIPAEDSLTVAYGVVGDYPNTFLTVSENELPSLVEQLSAVSKDEDYRALLDRFAVRRTDKRFWAFSDAIHQQYHRQQPLDAGWLDYNRFENR